MSRDDSIAKLARHIEGSVRENKPLLLSAEETARLRRQGAAQLHSICAEFVRSVNGRLSPPILEVSPAEYAPEHFRETGANLVQISGRGRIVQIAFESTRDRFSTEKYPLPYILEGEVRAYNQEMLDRFAIQNQGLFYCLDGDALVWRYSDWRWNRTGLFNHQLLASLLEQLF